MSDLRFLPDEGHQSAVNRWGMELPPPMPRRPAPPPADDALELREILAVVRRHVWGMLLAGVDLADFSFLLSALALTKGNLSSHMDRLERAGYVKVRKSFNGKMPHTDYHLTDLGQKALAKYWAALDEIRGASDGQKR